MYVYRFISKETIIYVGITKDIHSRMSQHKKSGIFFDYADNIEYAILPNKTSAELFEIYLINTYSPKYNTTYNRKDSLEVLSFKEMEWIKYEKSITKKEIYLKKPILKVTPVLFNENMLSFIENHLINLIDIYYDKYQHLCLLFNYKTCLDYEILRKTKQELKYYIDYINILSGIIYPVNIDENSTIEISFLNLYKTDNDEYKTAIKNLYELINYNSLNLDINRGIKIEENRISNILKTFDYWFLTKKPLKIINLLNNKIIDFDIDSLIKDLLNIKNYGNGFYELNYKKIKLKLYYDDFSYEIGKFYKNIEERNNSLKFKNQLLIFESQKYFHYFWFIMTKNKIKFIDGFEKEYLSSNSFVNSSFNLENEKFY